MSEFERVFGRTEQEGPLAGRPPFGNRRLGPLDVDHLGHQATRESGLQFFRSECDLDRELQLATARRVQAIDQLDGWVQLGPGEFGEIGDAKPIDLPHLQQRQ